LVGTCGTHKEIINVHKILVRKPEWSHNNNMDPKETGCEGGIK
jgi:hypothetical protein